MNTETATRTRDLQIAVEWDVDTWSRAVDFWTAAPHGVDLHGKKGLELGSRHGGLSYYFAKHYQARMHCSDYGGPSDNAALLHHEHGLNHLISYHDIDATDISFPDNYFDFVLFKSVLGVVGANDRFARIEQAVGEIHRVLRPGGVLLFAENLTGSPLHRMARRWFVPWGKAWRYLSLHEIDRLMTRFALYERHTTGFLAAFTPASPSWKRLAAAADRRLAFVPPSWRYVVYGYARK